MSLNYRTEEYYKRFIELQEKLRNSEEERLKLEMKFNEMVRVTKEETQAHYRKLRTQYKRFLEEDRRRQDRNERILRSLDRMDSRLAMLRAKTERFQLLRQQYHYFLDRIYKLNQTKIEPSKINRSEIKIDPPYTASKSESFSKPPIINEQVTYKNPAYSQSSDLLIDHYIQNLSSQRIRDLLRKEETARSQPSFSLLSDQNENIYSYGFKPSYNGEDLYNGGEGEFKPNYANSVADDIMNSIYSRPRPKLNEEVGKAPIFNENNSNLTKMSHSEINDNYSKKKSSQEDSDMDNEWSEAESVKAVNLPAAKSLDVVDDGKVIQPSSPPKISTPQNIEKEPSTPLFVSEEPPSESKLQTKDENIPKGMEITGEETETIADVIEKLTIRDEQPQEIVSIEEKPSGEILETEETYEQKLPSPEPINNHELEQVDKKIDECPAKEIPQPSSVPEEIQQVLNPTEPPQESQPIAEQKDQQYEETINPQEYYDESGQMYDETGQPILTSYDQYQQQPQYDESGQLIQQYQYDEQGQVIQLDENGQPIIQQFDETGYDQSYPQYDENGQLVQQYDESGQPIQQYYPEQQQQYDENGQPIQQYDENGQPIQEYYGNYEQQYDDSGQLIQQYDYSDQQYAAQDYPAEEVAHKELELSEKEIPDETQPVGKPEEPIQVATTENVDEEVDLSVESNKKEEDEEMEKSVEGKNAPNVMEMLDTDTESAKQDTKISNDSDFDFSNG